MSSIGDIGNKLDLVIKQGSTFGPFKVTLVNPDDTPVNLTGSTVNGQIRRSALDDSVAATLTAQITSATEGEFQFGLTSTETAQMVAGERKEDLASLYVWDMTLVDSEGRVIPLYYGDVRVVRGVTRA